MSLNGFYTNESFPWNARLAVKLKHNDKREIEKGVSLCFTTAFYNVKTEAKYRDIWAGLFSIQQRKYDDHPKHVYLHYENWVFEQVLKVVLANPATDVTLERQKY